LYLFFVHCLYEITQYKCRKTGKSNDGAAAAKEGGECDKLLLAAKWVHEAREQLLQGMHK